MVMVIRCRCRCRCCCCCYHINGKPTSCFHRTSEYLTLLLTLLFTFCSFIIKCFAFCKNKIALRISTCDEQPMSRWIILIWNRQQPFTISTICSNLFSNFVNWSLIKLNVTFYVCVCGNLMYRCAHILLGCVCSLALKCCSCHQPSTIIVSTAYAETLGKFEI